MIRISTTFLVHFALASTLTIASSGCTTVQVTKVQEPKPTSWTFWLNPLNLWDELTDSGPAEPDTKAKGVRYFLPKPYLLVTPLPGGKVDVSVVYLPDPDQEYAVDTHVYIASQDFRMEFAGEGDAEKGFLKQVTYDPKDPTVFGDIVKAAGTMGTQIIDDKKAKKDAEEKQRKDAASKLDELKKDERMQKAALDEKQYLLEEVAEKKLQRFNSKNSSPTGDKLSEKESLEDDVRVAKRARDLAQADYDKARDARTTFENRNPSATSDSPVDTAHPNLDVPSMDAWLPGPALFEIKEGKESLQLQIVKTQGSVESDPNGQMKLKTSMPASNGRRGTGKNSSFASTPPTESIAKDGYHIIPFEFSRPVVLDSFSVRMISVANPQKMHRLEPKELSGEGKQILTLKLPGDGSISGKWTIIIMRDREEFEGSTIDFK